MLIFTFLSVVAIASGCAYVSSQMKDGTVLQASAEPAYLHLIITRPGEQPASVAIPEDIGGWRNIFPLIDKSAVSSWVKNIFPMVDDKAAIIGNIGGGLSEVVIVDVRQQRITDEFWGYSPAPSPDGRYIVFIKAYPPHFIPDASDYVLLYDVTRGPDGNRPVGVPYLDKLVNAGAAVYPPGTKTQDNNIIGQMIAINISSGFLWAPDSSRFVFTEENQIPMYYYPVTKQYKMYPPKTILNLVLVNMATPYAPPSVFTVDKCAPKCREKLRSVEFGHDGIKANIQGFNRRGNSLRTIQVNYNEFIIPGSR